MAQENKGAVIDWRFMLVIALIILIVWFILKPSSDKKEEKEELKEQTTLTNNATDKKVKTAFNRTAYAGLIKTTKYKTSSDYLKSKGLQSTDIAKTAEKIDEAQGFWNDDEDKLYGVFRAIPNITIFSMVSNIFYYIYKKDLREYLLDFMTEKEMDKLYKIIIAKYYL